jgi:hypothetical protein
MANLFKGASDKVRSSPFVIPMFIVFVVMFAISIGVNIEDYTTSRLGYIEIPTRKANDWVIWLVAAIPQIGQIGFAYIFASDTNKRWSALIAASLHFVDVVTDVAYKAVPYSAVTVIASVIESELIYTLGSEIMLVASFGMIIALAPDFMRQFGNLMTRLFESLSEDDKPKRDSQPQRPQDNHNKGDKPQDNHNKGDNWQGNQVRGDYQDANRFFRK